MLTYSALVSSVAQQLDGENPNMSVHSDGVMLCLLPLLHMYAHCMVLCLLKNGAAILMMKEFNEARHDLMDVAALEAIHT